MIRILGKPLLKEWTTAQAFKPATNPTRSFSGCRRNIVETPAAFFIRPPSFTSLSRTKIGKTCYSTVPGQTDAKTKADVPPLPKPASPRKPKVDLRPAPKKASQEPSATPPRPPAPAKETIASSSKTPAPRVVSTPSSFSSPGPLEATKHDIAEATKHGILSPPPEDASRIGKVWHQLKQLFWFYWGGLKLIFVTHRRRAGAIRQRAKEAQARGEAAGLSRWETRFLQTYDRDLVKLVPFVLTLLILEEALPFIVLYAPGLLPSTCLLPSQRQRIEAKRRAKQMANVAVAKVEFQRLTAQGQDITSMSAEKGVGSLSANLARAVSGILSRGTWGPLILQRRRIRKHLASLSADDALLVKEDLGSRLKDDELVEALEERGFITDSQTPQQMREKLQWWLKGANDDNARLGLVLQAAVREPSDKVKAAT